MKLWCCSVAISILQTWGEAFLTFRSFSPSAIETIQPTNRLVLLANDSNAEENDPAQKSSTEEDNVPRPGDLTIVDEFEEMDNQDMPETSPRGSSDDDEANNLSFVTTIGATTNRGEFATEAQKEAVSKVVKGLENCQSSCNDARGTWELVYTSTQLFRGSPFFLAGRVTCQTQEDKEKYDWFCEMHRQALAVSQIQAVRQIITESSLTNEFEVSVGSIPFLNDFTPFSYSGGLPITITGAIVSTASLSPLTKDGVPMIWELFMDTVEIKGSNIPLLRQVLDLPQVSLPTRRLSNVLKDSIASYQTPKPILQTSYLTDKFRITRDQDDNIFVYVRTSSSTSTTDYSSRSSDLGIARLLEGFNDAVTKLYL